MASVCQLWPAIAAVDFMTITQFASRSTYPHCDTPPPPREREERWWHTDNQGEVRSVEKNVSKEGFPVNIK